MICGLWLNIINDFLMSVYIHIICYNENMIQGSNMLDRNIFYRGGFTYH